MLVCLNINTQLLEHFLLLFHFKLHILQVNLLLRLVVMHFLELWLALLSLYFATASLAATALALGYGNWPVGAARWSELSTTIDLTVLFYSVLFLLSLEFELLFDLHCYFVNIFDPSISRFFSLVFTHFLVHMLSFRTSWKFVNQVIYLLLVSLW
jgi:hypothetical protein